MKLTNRYYFDYNSTSPLSDSVKEFIKGDFFFANSNSLHSDGKYSKKIEREVISYIEDIFDISKDDYKIIFHSGTTEGLKLSFESFPENSIFYYSSVDHSSVENSLKDKNKKIFEVDYNGDYFKDLLIEEIKKEKHPVVLNYTWANNENGVVWTLDDAYEIKQKTNCFINVDATQSVGKIANFLKINKNLDSYTFSGHKFGALKGVGFSLSKRDIIRYGTHFSEGIYSLKLALQDIIKDFDPLSLSKIMNDFETKLLHLLADKGEIISLNAKERNLNTILFYLKNTPSDILQTAFDLNNISVGTGAACSSDSVKGNRILKAMGYKEDYLKNPIRLSFSSKLTQKEAEIYFDLVKNVLNKYL